MWSTFQEEVLAAYQRTVQPLLSMNDFVDQSGSHPLTTSGSVVLCNSSSDGDAPTR